MLKDKGMKIYIVTKKDCTESIRFSKRPICTHCGGKREAIETLDNLDRPTFWAGCNACNRFDIGTTEKIYNIASKMVEEGLVTYSYMTKPKKTDELFTYWKQTQTSGAVDIVTKILHYAKR